MSDDLVFKSVRELSKLVRTRRVSPVELSELSLRRLESLGPRYNAVVTVTSGRAMRLARDAEAQIAAGDYRGPLQGIPYGVKDLLATSRGIPTTWGAAPFRTQIFDFDATVVGRLEAAGGLLAAKLALMELAGFGGSHPNSSFTGPGINPWGEGRWSEGSSSGSGSAVAAGLVPFAIGSETWGSILHPSAACGLSGLRPSYGRVSRYGCMALSWTMDKLGPMCRTADDCGIVLEAIAGPDPNDPSASDRSFNYELGRTDGFRIGVPKGAADPSDEAVRRNFDEAVKVLGDVASVEEVELTDLPVEAAAWTIVSAELAAVFDGFIDQGGPDELTAEDSYKGYSRPAVLARDYLRALRVRGVVAREADDLLSRYDAIVSPTMHTVAGPVDEHPDSSRAEPVGALGNLAGLPAISVPTGFSDDGMPTAMQVLGRAYDENSILAVANAYQSLTEHHLQHPANLSA